MSLRVTIELPAGPFVAGEPVRGQVTVRGGDGIRGLEVSLVQVEWSKDYEAVGRREPPQSLAGGPVPDGRQLPFELALPLDAPPEVQTGHGGLAWEVQAKADVRGPDAIVGERISVSPD